VWLPALLGAGLVVAVNPGLGAARVVVEFFH
jgi:hypothetical protein